jgi:hypothetical protein
VRCGSCISIYWIYIRSLQSLITFPITSHIPVTSSGSSFVLNWRKLLLWSFCDELLWWTAMANSYSRLLWQSTLHCLYNLSDQLLFCSLPRYMRAYRPLLSCNNSPLFRLRGYLAYRTVGSNLVVSVAWQWIFPALGNSAFQTTCHSIILDQYGPN